MPKLDQSMGEEKKGREREKEWMCIVRERMFWGELERGDALGGTYTFTYDGGDSEDTNGPEQRKLA